MAIDINRFPVPAVQSRAGCFERAASTPLLLFLRSLAPRKVRKQFAWAALVATICRTLRIDPSAQHKAINNVWRCRPRMGDWRSGVLSECTPGSPEPNHANETICAGRRKPLHIAATMSRSGFTHDDLPRVPKFPTVIEFGKIRKAEQVPVVGSFE
jgi:hypothetical protein